MQSEFPYGQPTAIVVARALPDSTSCITHARREVPSATHFLNQVRSGLDVHRVLGREVRLSMVTSQQIFRRTRSMGGGSVAVNSSERGLVNFGFASSAVADTADSADSADSARAVCSRLIVPPLLLLPLLLFPVLHSDSTLNVKSNRRPKNETRLFTTKNAFSAPRP